MTKSDEKPGGNATREAGAKRRGGTPGAEARVVSSNGSGIGKRNFAQKRKRDDKSKDKAEPAG